MNTIFKLLLVSFVVVSLTACNFHTAQGIEGSDNRVVISADEEKSKISRHIYGQFAEHLGRGIYEGIWVGEDSDIPNTEGYRDDVLEALQQLEVPNIRWPGGCFADEYYWKDGIGPVEDRPTRINTHWGMVQEDNSFGTHEFLRFMELIDSEPVIAMNVGSGTPREMMQWLEYLNFDGESEMADLRREHGRDEPWGVKYIGVGNESWGCGGNMTPEFYSDLYRQFATYTKEFSGHELFRVASGRYDDQYDWTETMVENAGEHMEGISLHYYTIPTNDWDVKGESTDFGETEYFATLVQALDMDEYVRGHVNRLDKHDPDGNIELIVDEWGIWTDPLEGTNPGFLEQQNSMRDALVASTTLDILNYHSERVTMANIAQMVNVLQAMIRTDGEDMFKTPTYHIFDMYRAHYDTRLLHTHSQIGSYTYGDEEIPGLSHTVSKDEDGNINITVSNLHKDESQNVEFEVRGQDVSSISSARVLTADAVDAINTVDDPDRVTTQEFSDYDVRDNTVSVNLPPVSVVVFQVN